MADEWDTHSTTVVIEAVLRRMVANECLASPNPLAASKSWADWLKGQGDDFTKFAFAPDTRAAVKENAIRIAGEFGRFSDELQADVAGAVRQRP